MIVGKEKTSQNNLIQLGTLNENERIYWYATGYATGVTTGVTTQKDTIIGDKGSATVNIYNSALGSGQNLILANEQDAHATINMNYTALIHGKELVIGNHGTSTINANDGRILVNTVKLGTQKSGSGFINLHGANRVGDAYLHADTLIIGDAGKGEMNTSKYYYDNSWKRAATVDKAIIANQKGSQGKLDVQSSIFAADELMVGNEGTATLSVTNQGMLSVGNIVRNPLASTTVSINNGSIDLIRSEHDFFKGFDANTPIQVGANGIEFHNDFQYAVLDSSGNKYRDAYNYDVTINPNAVIKGYVGRTSETIDEDEGVLNGGFVKSGRGTLEMSGNTVQWHGDTVLNGGILKINGDYQMQAGDRLISVLLDDDYFDRTTGKWTDADNKIDPNMDDYGKLQVTGKADISKGALYVYADEAIKNTNKSTVWKDVIVAGELIGQFQSVTDNSPLVDFYANYNDANKVHLQLTAPTPTPTPTQATTFVDAVNSSKQLFALPMAKTLDTAVNAYIAGDQNTLALNLILDTINYNQAQLAQVAIESQPLLLGATNRILTDTSRATTSSIYEHLADTQQEQNLWIKMVGQDGKHKQHNAIGYEHSDYGVIAGADTTVNNARLGLALSYMSSDANSKHHIAQHKVKADTAQAIIYADYQVTPQTTLYGHTGVATSQIKGTRHLNFNNTMAKSKYDATSYMAGIGLSHQIGYFTPFVQTDYNVIHSDAYQETGADAYNLSIHKNSYESLSSRIGTMVKYSFTPKVHLTGQFAIGLDSGDSYSTIQGHYLDNAQLDFAMTGQKVDRTFATTGARLSYQPKANIEIASQYTGEWRENYRNNGGSLLFRMKF